MAVHRQLNSGKLFLQGGVILRTSAQVGPTIKEAGNGLWIHLARSSRGGHENDRARDGWIVPGNHVGGRGQREDMLSFVDLLRTALERHPDI